MEDLEAVFAVHTLAGFDYLKGGGRAACGELHTIASSCRTPDAHIHQFSRPLEEWEARGYTWHMIRTFRHKGLRLLFEKGDRRKVQSDHANKIGRILARLEEASEVGNMDLPGFRLHPLKLSLIHI